MLVRCGESFLSGFYESSLFYVGLKAQGPYPPYDCCRTMRILENSAAAFVIRWGIDDRSRDPFSSILFLAGREWRVTAGRQRRE